MQLNNIINITGTLHLLSGLHIGAGKDSIEIGGLDLPIIKNPLTKAPYIPGSSIKGKMRSMLEVFCFSKENPETLKWIQGEHNNSSSKASACGCCQTECMACVMFGAHNSSDQKSGLGPTRLIVRDAILTDSFDKMHKDGNLPMEIKYENTIHRVKGIAENPRPVERVPAGVEFNFEMSLKIYASDNENNFIEVLKKGLKLIELDALGGHSSRGSGRVRFENIHIGNDILKNLDSVTL